MYEYNIFNYQNHLHVTMRVIQYELAKS